MLWLGLLHRTAMPCTFALAVLGVMSAARAQELSMGNVNPQKHGTSLASQQFADKLAELTGGQRASSGSCVSTIFYKCRALPGLAGCRFLRRKAAHLSSQRMLLGPIPANGSDIGPNGPGYASTDGAAHGACNRFALERDQRFAKSVSCRWIAGTLTAFGSKSASYHSLSSAWRGWFGSAMASRNSA